MKWNDDVERMIVEFSKKHSVAYNKTERQLSGAFEIGCFHALLNYYENIGYTSKIENLIEDEYHYLTTPNGNPDNYSFVSISGVDGEYEIRQQVRIKSYLDEDIAFAPDIAVLYKGATVEKIKDKDYASGKRPFYTVSSNFVVAAHECKSRPPFPELLVSFIGMFIPAHSWYGMQNWEKIINKDGKHIAPTMFVGGTASNLHLRMIRAMEKVYPINIVVGLHQGTWNLYSKDRNLNLLQFDPNFTYKTSESICQISESNDDIPF